MFANLGIKFYLEISLAFNSPDLNGLRRKFMQFHRSLPPQVTSLETA
ncbi:MULTISPECIES: hypothetical protein [unclassified Campylobacter]|nr:MULTISPECIES: hypothetical protein [unclassified Campylobacter]MDA3056164.1 hypothetical protein [Campylobacter sp. CN_NA1]MDA3065309.1 hypothetical protein [Campylobacter sp. CN_NE4]MDA3068135.1 hypothetical protein [Campylobacter sp. CN_NE3]MDA3082762.1 hypothetical protein [Campylobacter sp. CN_EL2]